MIVNASGSPINYLFYRVPSTQAEAATDPNNYVAYAWDFEDLQFTGNNSATRGSNDNGLFIGATYMTTFKNCLFSNFDRPTRLEYCLDAKFDNCTWHESTDTALHATFGSWAGAVQNNSASNGVVVERSKFRTAEGAYAAAYINGATACEFNSNTFEGNSVTPPERLVVCDGTASTVVKTFSMKNTYIEQDVTKSWLQFIMQSNFLSVNIDTVEMYVTAARSLVSCDTRAISSGNDGVIDLKLFNACNNDTLWTLRRSGAGYTYFDIDKSVINNQTNISDPINWDTTTIDGRVGTIPAGNFLACRRGIFPQFF